jgi:hypothetical protein
MQVLEFAPWPKTPRLFRDAIITEKIDGTNAAIHVRAVDSQVQLAGGVVVETEAGPRLVGAQSRKRLIAPGDDNFGFAAWVHEHAALLADWLGEGVHFGEWWGSGIQRGYGLPRGERRFSLFNVSRYAGLAADATVPASMTAGDIGLGVVPVLSRHTFDTEQVRVTLAALERRGSQAAPGFMRPEGVVVYHSAAGCVFKALLDGDALPKSLAAAA